MHKKHTARFCFPFFRNIFFFWLLAMLHLYVAPWFEGSRFFSRIHTGPSDRPTGTLTNRQKKILCYFSLLLSFLSRSGRFRDVGGWGETLH